MERQLLLLGILRAQKMHGYQLNDFLEKHYDFVTDLKPSTAYYLLDRLAAEDYVQMHLEQVGNRPQRRVYELTPKGEAYFFDLLRANLQERAKPVYGDEVGLAFLGALPPGEVQAYLLEKCRLLREELQHLTALAEAIRPSARSDVNFTLDHHLVMLRAELAWWEQLVKRMDKQA